jgi:hypothetical protein
MRHWIGRVLLGAVLVTAGCDDPNLPGHAPQPALTGGWSTAGCEFHREPMSVTMGRVTMPLTPPELDAAMARIDRAGREQHPGSYAGLEVDQAYVRAIVYRVPSAAFDDAIRYAAEDACVVVRDAPHALTELTAWHDRLVADLPYWTGRGVRITSVGARHDGVGVEVGTQDLSQARVEFPGVYGPSAPLVLVESGPVTPLSSPTGPPAPQPGG